MIPYTWDKIRRFKNDPCGCVLCKKIQKAVKSRDPMEKLKTQYRNEEMKISVSDDQTVAMVEIG